jgi:hypothetical protein
MRQSGFPVGDARTEAIDALDDVLLWRLSLDCWLAVERVVHAMETAVDMADLTALAAATQELELMGPWRMVPIGATSTESSPIPASDRVRERLNHLIHSLGGVVPPRSSDTERRENHDDGSAGR